MTAFRNNYIFNHDSKSKAKPLNHRLMSVFTMDNGTDHLPSMSHTNIEDMTIGIEGVEKLVDNINIRKTSGPDKISNIIIKTF